MRRDHRRGLARADRVGEVGVAALDDAGDPRFWCGRHFQEEVTPGVVR
jgi:hypothetical protein